MDVRDLVSDAAEKDGAWLRMLSQARPQNNVLSLSLASSRYQRRD